MTCLDPELYEVVVLCEIKQCMDYNDIDGQMVIEEINEWFKSPLNHRVLEKVCSNLVLILAKY